MNLQFAVGSLLLVSSLQLFGLKDSRQLPTVNRPLPIANSPLRTAHRKLPTEHRQLKK